MVIVVGVGAVGIVGVPVVVIGGSWRIRGSGTVMARRRAEVGGDEEGRLEGVGSRRIRRGWMRGVGGGGRRRGWKRRRGGTGGGEGLGEGKAGVCGRKRRRDRKRCEIRTRTEGGTTKQKTKK